MVVDCVVVLADELVWLLIHFDDRIAHIRILSWQLIPGQMLHDASPERVAQHIGGGPQPVPVDDIRKE